MQGKSEASLATLGGGCFWCLEAVFERLEGVSKVVSGYSGGHVDHPTYQQVCQGTTGHAEVVQLTFDPSVISYPEVLEVFFAIHDPTTLNRQGHDVGTQYRSLILWHDQAQRTAAQETIDALSRQGIWNAPIVTALEPYTVFFPAEGYHREYFRNNPEQPYCQAVVAPKVTKFRQRFAHRLKK